MATTLYGLTPQGFVPKPQSVIIAEIQAALQAIIGANVNFGPESIIQQFIGIFAEREALIWMVAEAVNASKYPSGAEGTSVDNILALNNLQRLQATPTVTNPEPLKGSNLITQFGLVLFGTPGTPIPAGSVVKNQASPPISLTLDSPVTIAPAANAIQAISLSNVPNTGGFQFSIQDNNNNVLDEEGNVIAYNGNVLTSVLIPNTARTTQTLLNFSALPVASSSFQLQLTRTGAVLTTGAITTNGAYPTSADIQTAIRALAGYSAVTVAGSAGAYLITWGSISQPTVLPAANTTGATIAVTDSVQSAFNNLFDSNVSVNQYPYSDVQVTAGFSSAGFTARFGQLTPTTGNLSSGSQPQSLMTQALNTLFNGGTFTSINFLSTQTGAPAQGSGTATATVTGPNFVGAGTINVIGSPISGWTGVTNQLDAITGTNVETDTQAIERFEALRASQANGPLQAIIEKVEDTVSEPPITSVLGFQNLSNAAIQEISFAGVPATAQTFVLSIGLVSTAPITINNDSNDASNIQTAIQALAGYVATLVTGNTNAGFSVDFNGSNGGQPQPLMTTSLNNLGVTINVEFGRPGHSIEIVVQGGSITDIANAILASKPGGIQTYGDSFDTTATTILGNEQLNSVIDTSGIVDGMLVTGPGILPNTRVVSFTSNTVTMTQGATASGTNIPLQFSYSAIVSDTRGNKYQINFSRPALLPIFVSIALVTDTYNIPGDSVSGLNTNALWNPASINDIEADLLAIGNAIQIGGRVIGFGTSGLVGAFNSVPGIVSYTLFFGISANPTMNSYIQLLPEQLADFDTSHFVVSYT